MSDLTTLNLGSRPRKQFPSRQVQKDPSGPNLSEARFFALLMAVFAVAFAITVAYEYSVQRKPESLGGMPQEVLVWKDSKDGVANGYTRLWTSPRDNVLAIAFQTFSSIEGKWVGSNGVAWVTGEKPLSGSHGCVPKERVADWRKEISTESGNLGVEFAPECSVELPIAESNVHKTFNLAARMDVRYPVFVGGGAILGQTQVAPGGFENRTYEVSRELQLFIASDEEAERMHHFNKQQTPRPYEPVNMDAAICLLSLGLLGGAVLLWRRGAVPPPAVSKTSGVTFHDGDRRAA